MKKNKVVAFYNWNSGWTAACPKCGRNALEAVAPGKPFICSRCFPGIHATMQTSGKKGRIITIPDMAMREIAYKNAVKNNGLYEVIFPKNMNNIMQALMIRPPQNRNWYPHETLSDILRENKEHGL